MIYVIRHGQTEKNKANSLQGRSDDPLTPKGTEQAEQLRDWFRSQGISFDTVYSSPLVRASDTGRIAASGVEPVIDERLIEMDYGPYEGMDLTNPPPEILVFFSDFVNHPAPEGMEQLCDVVKRSGEFIEDIKKEAEGKNVLISTHAIAMKGILEYLTPGSNGAYWSKYIGNCAVYAFQLKDGRCSVPEEIATIPGG